MTRETLEKQILSLIGQLEKTPIEDWSYDISSDLMIHEALGVSCNIDDSSIARSTKFYIDGFKIALGSGKKGSVERLRSFLAALKIRLASAKVEEARKMAIARAAVE